MVTAVLNVLDKDQKAVSCRALLDTCSTTNFMTLNLAETLRLKTTTCRIPIGALNTMTTYCNKITTATITSRVNNFKRTLTFLIIPTISHIVPDQPIQREKLKIPANIKLADPTFHKPGPIDILIGAGTTLSVLSVGQIPLSLPNQQELFLQKTLLGWILGGAAPTSKSITAPQCHVTSTINFDLNKFWEIEECPTTSKLTPEEEQCELHFQKHVSRARDGRYVVALPFNPSSPDLGESYHLALKRLRSTERKLKNDPDLEAQYHKVMQEYIDLNHMSPVNVLPSDTPNYYLPHHAVIKSSSMTTKVRVVFDGSANTTTGVSLNDVLFTGPTIQSDLFSLLIRFRKYPIVLTGDVEKMYRQFWMRKEDRRYQRILWRNSNNEIQVYELDTVTFGIRTSPYLAIRCLHQLADDEGKVFPIAAKVLKEDFYVDDLLSGAEDEKKAIILRQQVTQILAKAGLTIRQWASNNSAVLKDVPQENINPRLQLGDSTLKTLGICWESSTDSIIYTVKPIASSEQVKITKRSILSEVAKIFDPLGLLAPVIIVAKILIQKLWDAKLDWDESLPIQLHTEWKTYCTQLNILNQASFPRTIISPNTQHYQLHGFCDASEKAYGACIYLRVTDPQGKIQVLLVCAKSKVAPLKTITIPRLELCGAQLLSSLMKATITASKMTFDNVYYWTDSTIVLNWLNTSPHQLKTFVSNRISDIQTKTDVKSWSHVPTKDNPADLVSRGVLPAEFIAMNIWKHGPSWLSKPAENWPTYQLPLLKEIPEQRRATCLMTIPQEFVDLTRFSSYNRMIRSLVYCLRFGKRSSPRKGPLTIRELRDMETRIIKAVQQQAFAKEIKELQESETLTHNTAQLAKLTPKIDDQQIMRVGGRLSSSDLPYSAKHPIILPKNNHVTNIIIRHYHNLHLHTGVHQTLYLIRRKYWIIDGRSQVFKVLRGCLQCWKRKPPSPNYLMGDLPRQRVTSSRPFSQVGVDYCGPFSLKEKKYYNRTTIKAYVAVFVCLSIKAVHLELVTDLTSEGFIAALRRFVSRRGLCQDIFSDNGTNFVGANNILKELTAELHTTKAQDKIQCYLTSKGIQWHFISPRAPHVGGLWEAAVKSFKRHLLHVAGLDLLFTYEQFNTLIIEIEAILNSRPLTPISLDPNDPIVLTPGHFLIGDSLTNLPDRNHSDVPTNRLKTWEHIQKVKQDFWKRWRREYLTEIIQRTKWNKAVPNITTGTVVILKEDNLPPSQWALGRIIECYPGHDGVVRTVKVKTATTSFVRNVKKLAILPITPIEVDSK